MISANAHEKCGFKADLSPSLRMLHGKKTVPSTDPKEALLVLLEVTRELAERRPLEESLSVVTRAAVRLVRADHASVRLLDSTRTELLCGARTGSGADTRPMTFRPGEGFIGLCVTEQKAFRIGDVASDARFVPQPAQSSFVIGSLMCEPMWSSGEVVGVLSVTSPEREAFSADDQLLLRLLANCSSPPVERARLERLATFDDLTLAMSHRYLVPRMAEEIERATRTGSEMSILLMDLDHFKNVNDEHGHAVGDAVLRAFADRVRKLVRKVDVLVRRGGEEFVLVMPRTGSTQALATGKRIQESLERERLVTPKLSLRKTVSIGVATWDGRESPESLERRADMAMYEAKRYGRNRVVVSTRESTTDLGPDSEG